MRQMRKRGGFVVIAVLGLLALLTGVTWMQVRLAAVERAISHNAVDRVALRMRAEAGLEAAIAAVRAEELARAASDPAAAGTRGLIAGAPAGVELRIVDANALVDANLGDLEEPSSPDNAPLVRMIDSLARAGGVAGGDLGARVVAFRPRGGYACVDDLRPVLGEAFERLAPFLGVHAWRDASVVAPVPLAHRTSFGRWPLPRVGGPVFAPLQLHCACVRRAPRAPIDVNLAPRAVLFAALAGVSGVALDARLAGADRLGEAFSLGRLVASRPVTDAQAREVADHIAASRPFGTWEAFRAFLRGLAADGTIDALQAAALLANAHPTLHLNESAPPAEVASPIDKTDLVASTTELCLRTMGRFEVTSTAREGGLVEAVVADVRLFDARRVEVGSTLPLAIDTSHDAHDVLRVAPSLCRDWRAAGAEADPDAIGPVLGAPLREGLPGSLDPEGLFVEPLRTPTWRVRGRGFEECGHVSFWFRPLRDLAVDRERFCPLVVGLGEAAARLEFVPEEGEARDRWTLRVGETTWASAPGQPIPSAGRWHLLSLGWRDRGLAWDLRVDGTACALLGGRGARPLGACGELRIRPGNDQQAGIARRGGADGSMVLDDLCASSEPLTDREAAMRWAAGRYARTVTVIALGAAPRHAPPLVDVRGGGTRTRVSVAASGDLVVDAMAEPAPLLVAPVVDDVVLATASDVVFLSMRCGTTR